jgi:hypothetical protein
MNAKRKGTRNEHRSACLLEAAGYAGIGPVVARRRLVRRAQDRHETILETIQALHPQPAGFQKEDGWEVQCRRPTVGSQGTVR